MQPVSLQIGGRVGLPEAGLMLDIVPHRPDIRAALQEAAAEAADIGGGGDVGVYAAGASAGLPIHACRKPALSCCTRDGGLFCTARLLLARHRPLVCSAVMLMRDARQAMTWPACSPGHAAVGAHTAAVGKQSQAGT
jgi:hypothetical protein